jgi:endonuclease III
MDEKTIGDRLVEHGHALFSAPWRQVPFTRIEPADALLNDLKGHPHAFVLACVMDRQIKAEKSLDHSLHDQRASCRLLHRDAGKAVER